MRTRKNIYFKVIASVTIAIAFTIPAKTQLSDNGCANIDWQFNTPLSSHFTDKASGWDVNSKGGYFVTPDVDLGLFLSYYSSHEYVGRETFQMGAGEVITDQQHTIFQLPFGAVARYQWSRGGSFQPYVSAKLGAEYVRIRSDFNMLEAREDSWGFYASPGVGINVFPWAYRPGLHFALYYSHGTNEADILHYSVDGLSNFGFCLGVSF